MYKKNVLRRVFVPDLDDPLRGTADEYVRDEGVPLDVVHRGVVRRETVQVSREETKLEEVFSMFNMRLITAWNLRKLSNGDNFLVCQPGFRFENLNLMSETFKFHLQIYKVVCLGLVST